MKKVSVFANGSQYHKWTARNCERCAKSVNIWGTEDDWPTCEIEEALLLAYMDDGAVTPEIAWRMGYVPLTYTWACPEKKDEGVLAGTWGANTIEN